MNPAFSSLLSDSSSQKPSPKLEYGGNKFTQLSAQQQSNVYKELLKRCHSLDILRAEFHILENETPPRGVEAQLGSELEDFAAAPKGHSSTGPRKAVAVRCEWGRLADLRRELLAICAIDVLTGETLIESLVTPLRQVKKWRDNGHGITLGKITAARKKNQCLRGWKEARAKLFEHIDEKTVLIGYAIGTDLRLLHLFHKKIIDSRILATSPISGQQLDPKQRPEWPMSKICSDFLGFASQQNAIYTSGTESAFENVLVSREIVLQSIQRPKEFARWVTKSRGEFFKSQKANRRGKNQGPSQQPNAIQQQTDTETAKNEGEAQKSGDPDARPGVETTVGPISDKNQAAGTFTEGYEAGYLAGFQKGLENGLKQANSQENKAMEDILHQPPNEREHTCQKSIQHIDGEESFSDHSQVLNQIDSDNDDWAPA
ncbi:hypothetical protein Trisim1_002518 [Trichoderma cf. simile WF8]